MNGRYRLVEGAPLLLRLKNRWHNCSYFEVSGCTYDENKNEWRENENENKNTKAGLVSGSTLDSLQVSVSWHSIEMYGTLGSKMINSIQISEFVKQEPSGFTRSTEI